MVDTSSRIKNLKQLLELDAKVERVKDIEAVINSADFWSDDAISKQKLKELKNLKQIIDSINELDDLSQLAQSEEDNRLIENKLTELEKIAYFNGKYDKNGVVINFYAGAGGDDAQDWTEMLLAMYLKWAQKKAYHSKIIDQSRGAIAGVKSATCEIDAPYLYGQLKAESGVHRLVRQSPFNAKALRQTSFSLVEILPKIDDKSEITIDDKDLKIDTYRASGKGGQGVNTTDSAVRITYQPANIVVTCQNERSQLQNKETAMSVLRSRLALMLEQEHKDKISELKGELKDIEWGSQIRSYVLHPYKLVKDHRTQYESKDPEAVLNGDLDGFIEAEMNIITSNN